MSNGALTSPELTIIRARVNETTPGPWILMPELCGPDGQGVYQQDSLGHICEVGDGYARGDNRPQENMEFIAHSRSDVPKLLDYIALLEERRDAVLALHHPETRTEWVPVFDEFDEPRRRVDGCMCGASYYPCPTIKAARGEDRK